MQTQFYIEKVEGSCFAEYRICSRDDASIWAKAYSEDIAKVILDSLNKMKS